MIQRILTAAAGLLIMAGFLLFYQTPVISLMVVIVTCSSVYEFLSANKYDKNKPLFIISLIFSVVVPFLPNLFMILIALYTYVFLSFLLLIIYHKDLMAQDVSFTFLMTAFITCSLTLVIFLKNIYPSDFILYFLLSLGGGWLADSGAYFVGVTFGRNKLCPDISPKKTVEGAIGGFVGTVVGYLIVALVYVSVFHSASIDFPVLIIIALVLTPIGMIGDLTASVFKRQRNIKDYGSILPGHGGMLDRFDSVIFVMPVAYLLFSMFPVIH